MSDGEDLLREADANQARASDPAASAWVSANAGTGKTEVLVKRSLRLLLAGSGPESILCLTYTKTAAAEMQNRLLKELAAGPPWPSRVHDKLAALMRCRRGSEDYRRAAPICTRARRRGGLKIYTIHGFCERLLQRFPLEAAGLAAFRRARRARSRRFAPRCLRRRDDAGRRRERQRARQRRSRRSSRSPPKTISAKSSTTCCASATRSSALSAHHGGEPEWPEAERQALKRLFGVADERRGGA